MAGYLTTHVLDTARGCPAAGLRIELFRIGNDGARKKLAEAVTNADGRTDAPILSEADFATGAYELMFHAGAYLDAHAPKDGAARFLNLIPLRFEMGASAHFHVPLLLSPYGYSTYRGS